MIEHFKKLSESQIELMFKAPLLVCILVAGADGTIDKNEIEEAIVLARDLSFSDSLLTEYFKEVSQDFEDKLKIVIQSYPYKPSQRIPIIVEELSALNDLFPILDKTFARQFYKVLMNIAEKVASSSGGLLGMNAVGSEEAKFVKLPMIWDPSVQ